MKRHHVVGLGRWGSWLARRLAAIGAPLTSVASRDTTKVQAYASELAVAQVELPARAADLDGDDVVWLCTPDDALEGWLYGFAERLQGDEERGHPLVVVASGAAPIESLGRAYGRLACMWPVQSISLAVEPAWPRLPIVVQAVRERDGADLLGLAARISGLSPKLVDDDAMRLRLHLGAVLVQNFANLLWTEADQLLSGYGLDVRTLLPLAQTHLVALAQASPAALQTGPAVRGDARTMQRHRALLAAGEHRELLALYDALSARIHDLRSKS